MSRKQLTEQILRTAALLVELPRRQALQVAAHLVFLQQAGVEL